MTLRAAFYVDGFNLYHAINDFGDPFLKWCNLRELAQILIPSTSQTLVRIVFCTAYYPGDSQKRWRHDQFLNALRIVDVEINLGHYVNEKQNCRHCGARWDKPTEKQTDINLALSLYNDAKDDVFDVAYLLTATPIRRRRRHSSRGSVRTRSSSPSHRRAGSLRCTSPSLHQAARSA